MAWTERRWFDQTSIPTVNLCKRGMKVALTAGTPWAPPTDHWSMLAVDRVAWSNR